MMDLAELQTDINNAQHIVFLTGAGVSTHSGIPDYRSKNGIYDGVQESPETILSDSTLFNRPEFFHEFVMNNMYFPTAKPNLIHEKIAHFCNESGTIYIYAQRQYFFFDVATRVQNEPQGVLIRAIDPTLGIETMIKNRHGKDGVLLTNGPAKMMQAFGIHDKNWNLHFLSDSPFAIDLDDHHKKIPQEIIAAARVGINQSDPVWANKKLRFYVAGNPYVSDMKKRNYETNNAKCIIFCGKLNK